MPNFSFKPDQPQLSNLLEEMHEGALQLPDFQRSWVWDDDRIRALLASVSLGWPVGAILLLECGGELRFKAREFEGAPPNPGKERRLALDGQQRLTSLYLALRSGKPVKTVTNKRQETERYYYFDIRKCLDENIDREEAILSIKKNRQVRSNFNRDIDLDLSSPELEYKNFCIPAYTAFSASESRQWRRNLSEAHGMSREVSDLWDQFEAQVVDQLQAYRLPAIELSRETSREAVCMVFEKVNTGGKPLDVFELVTASFAIDNFDLRNDWTERKKRVKRRKVLREVSSAEFLQSVTLLHSYRRQLSGEGKSTGCRRSDILRLTADAYRELADDVEEGLNRCALLLDQHAIYDAAYIPYQTQLIPMAAIAAQLGPRFLEEPGRSKVARWYWSGVFGELYAGTTETRFARDIGEVVSWVEGGAEPTTVRDCNFSPSRLLSLRTKNSAAYKGFMALLLQSGARDFYQGDEIERSRYFDEKVDIHHVFPKAWCEKKGVSKDRYNSILNKTPLAARTNKRIGSKAPSAYLAVIEKDGISDLTSSLASHLLDDAAMRSDDFERALRTRAQHLLDQVEAATGKGVPGRDSEEVQKNFGGTLPHIEPPTEETDRVQKMFDKYEVLDQLPSGGMSEGFKVKDAEGAVLFLKKVPTAGVPADALRREQDVYSRLARSKAKHVLEVYGFERNEQAIALLTEYADQGSLDAKVGTSGLQAGEAKSVGLEVLSGLSELHSLEIVHRDLKPENIFCAKGRWKLGDFGISKSLQRLQTQGRTFQGHGTRGFAPPEQLQGAVAHPSADIYAFGKLIAYMLTGQTDVDQIPWPAWADLARDCIARDPESRPSLDDLETRLTSIPV